MARATQFWAEPVTRKYKGEARQVWRACWIDQSGTERTAERKGWRQKDALEFARDEWVKVRSGTFATKTSATMDDAIGLWLKDLDERRELTVRRKVDRKLSVCGAYHKAQIRLAETILSPIFGKLHPDEVDKRLIERWGRQVVLDGTMTPYQVNYAVKRLRIILDHAQAIRWTAINKLRVKLALPEVEPVDVIVPEDDDIVALLHTMDTDFCPPGESEVLFSSLRMAIFLVAYAGMRPNEASALRWEDVNLDRLEIHQHRGFTYEEGHKLSGKTRASIRTIDIMPQVHAEFLAYQKRTAEITPMPGRLATWRALAERNANPGTGLVLCNAYMGTLSPESIGIHWRKLRARVSERDLSKISLYSLRHYAGSIWLRGGMSLARVSKMMGHTDIRTTEKHYIKILRELDEDRLHDMRQIGHGLDRRYQALGLQLASTPVPMLTPPDPIVLERPPVLPAPDPEPTVAPAITEPAQAPTPRTVRALVAQQRRDVLAAYDAGMKVPVIARKLEMSETNVRNIIDDRVTEVRTGPSKRDLPRVDRAQRDAEARRLAEEEGLSYREIAARVGMRVGSLRQLAHRQGWKAAKKPVRYNHGQYKSSEEERARAALHQRRYRARQRGEEEPPLPPLPPKQIGRPRVLNDEERIEHSRDSSRKYKTSEKGRESTQRYRQSEKNNEAQHRYKTSEKGKAAGRRDRKKYWERKRTSAKTVEMTCECGRTFLRPYKPGKPRTKCEVCSPPEADRNARRREDRRRVREERTAVIDVAAEQVGTNQRQMAVGD
jgi:integrase/DNA-directed RNA polymerase specialized sigma24 family protein